MKQETSALENNGTWELTRLPARKHALCSKLVYKIKHKADGLVEKVQSMSCCSWNTQKEVVDFIETFTLGAKMVTLLVF